MNNNDKYVIPYRIIEMIKNGQNQTDVGKNPFSLKLAKIGIM